MRHAAALSLRSTALWSGSAACAGGVELVSHSDGAIGLLSPPLPLLPSVASMPLFMHTEGHIMEPRGVGYPALRPYRSQVVGEQACGWKESIITLKTKTTLSLPSPNPIPKNYIWWEGKEMAQLRSKWWYFFSFLGKQSTYRNLCYFITGICDWPRAAAYLMAIGWGLQGQEVTARFPQSHPGRNVRYHTHAHCCVWKTETVFLCLWRSGAVCPHARPSFCTAPTTERRRNIEKYIDIKSRMEFDMLVESVMHWESD